MYKVYAKINDEGYVTNIYSTCFYEANKKDIFIKEGYGDEFIHVQGSFDLFHENGSFKYKIINNKMIEVEQQEIIKESTEIEILTKKMSILEEGLQAVLSGDMQSLACILYPKDFTDLDKNITTLEIH